MPLFWPLLGAIAAFSLLLVIAAQALASAMHASDGGDPQTASAPCRVSGGGCVSATGGAGSRLQAIFNGDVSRLHDAANPPPCSWQHVYYDGHTILVSFHSLDARVVGCHPEPHGSCPPPDGATRAEFEGTGKVVLGDEGAELDANFQASIVDVGACGGTERDFYSITIRRGLIIGQGDVLHDLSGSIDCGNLKVEAPWRGRDRGAGLGASPHTTESGGQ